MKEETQLTMIEDSKDTLPTKVAYLCVYHKWITEESLIDYTIKKNGRVIKRCRFCVRNQLENKKINKQAWEEEKKNLTDYYIRRSLRINSKLHMQDFPPELIEMKRATMQLKRLTEQMEAPLLECREHGKCYRDDVIKSGRDSQGNQKYKCKTCMKEFHKKHYELNKAKVLAKHNLYKEKNKEKVKKIKRDSWIKHHAKYTDRENERKKMWERIGTRSLSDRYVKKTLAKRSALSMSDIPDSLIEAKRAILQLRRSTKQKSDENKLITLGVKLNVEK